VARLQAVLQQTQPAIPVATIRVLQGFLNLVVELVFGQEADRAGLDDSVDAAPAVPALHLMKNTIGPAGGVRLE